jgi:hypothetical protein
VLARDKEKTGAAQLARETVFHQVAWRPSPGRGDEDEEYNASCECAKLLAGGPGYPGVACQQDDMAPLTKTTCYLPWRPGPGRQERGLFCEIFAGKVYFVLKIEQRVIFVDFHQSCRACRADRMFVRCQEMCLQTICS